MQGVGRLCIPCLLAVVVLGFERLGVKRLSVVESSDVLDQWQIVCKEASIKVWLVDEYYKDKCEPERTSQICISTKGSVFKRPVSGSSATPPSLYPAGESGKFSEHKDLEASLKEHASQGDLFSMVFDYEDMVERSQPRKDLTMFVFSKLLETGAPTRLLPRVISASEQIVSEKEADKHKILLTMKEAAEKGENGSVLNQSLELRRLGIQVSAIEKRFLCLAQAKAGNIEAAIAELEDARVELKEEPDEEFYAIIADHKNDILWLATARELMSQRNVPVRKKFLQAEMQVLLRHSKLAVVHKTLNEKPWSEFQDPFRLSLDLITAYGKKGEPRKARRVAKRGKCGEYLKNTLQVRRQLFRAYCLADDLNLARTALRSLWRGFPGTRRDLQAGKDCALLIEALGRAKLPREAEQRFSKWMRTKTLGRRPSEPFHAILEMYANDGKVQAVKVILRLMKMQMISDASRHDDWYLALAHLEHNEPLKAARVADELSHKKSPVSPSLARRIFFSLARNCKPEDCERFQYSQHLFTDRNVWNGVLISWAKQGCERNIVRVLNAMYSRGVMPNRHTYDCIAGFLARKGANSVEEFFVSELAVQAAEIGLGFKKLEEAIARRQERNSSGT